MLKDCRGHAVTGATENSLPYYEAAVRELNLFINDPVASVDKAIAESPDFVMAHALRARLHLLGTEPAGIAVARASRDAARALPATAQEQGHLDAIDHLIEGRWHQAAQVMEDVAIENPHDLLALQVGHQLDFFRGEARMLRDRIARALPAWSNDVPGYHTMLGMHAFGLEETGDYIAAEVAGRTAVALNARDSWAQHAVAHVMEMQGRQQEGITWMTGNTEGWSRDSFFAVHNWWHVALYHLDLGQADEALKLFDGPIYGAKSKIILEMIDASAMLWRMQLRGVDVGDRWQAVADAWQPHAGAGNYAFNDAHAAMAFVGAGRKDALAQVIEAQQEAMQRDGDNAMFTRKVGHPIVLAIKAFGDGNYADALRRLREVRNIAHRFGGSHAQRDVLDLTLIESALRSGQHSIATALAAERLATRPKSPLSRLFVQRAAQMKQAA
ncbi:MAG: tetratricopeptide repeat protein [Xanthobacteraceae bacterium]|nr:tetratricopeptide repeat protein [Xanthobacteraceae bacterium]